MLMRALTIAVAAMFAVGAAQAAYLFDWDTNGNVVFVADPAGEQPEYASVPWVDITTGIWWGMDAPDTPGASTYFRMDLAGTPDPSSPAYPLAYTYGIYVDMRSWGATGGTDDLIPDELNTGIIDYFLTATWNGSGYNTAVHLPPAHGQDMTGWSGYGFQATENGGTTLEWQIPSAALDAYANPSPMFWGATVLDVLSGPTGMPETYTLDLTDSGVTPEPTTLALLGLGLGGLYFRRRRTSRAAGD